MIWLYFITGILVGFGISIFVLKGRAFKNVSGNLKQANDNGETYLFLELKSSPDEIMREDYVMFKVDKQKIVPHK